jgi:6-phosphogluconolactonase (cycloisomerase 2 family)
MRRLKTLIAGIGLAGALFAGASVAAELPLTTGKVFTSTTAPGGNELLVLAPGDDGLTVVAREATDGVGTGAGLGSQGAVTLSSDGRFVFVVNAASNTVSTFALTPRRAQLASVVASGGLMPTSVTESNGIVYVLNAGGAGNIAGFRNVNGQLEPLPDGARPLSASGGTAPAQVGFGRDVLVVTERATNRLVSYRASPNGIAGAPVVTPSSGVTPFGFAFDRRDRLVVSEAFGGAAGASAASSYKFDERSPDVPLLVSASVPTLQTAACWVAITPDGRFAYTGNAGHSSLSSFRIGTDGSITLIAAAAGITGPNAGVTDLAVSRDGRHVYALAPRGQLIASFAVSHDGSLTQEASATGLPGTIAGLAAN